MPADDPPSAPATAWRAALRGTRASFVFLTRLPVGGHPYDDAAWAWAPAHFPMVGLVLGALLAVAHRALSPLGPLADATVVLGASLLLTGALHEDGLADTADALGGARDRDQVFAILKDSRIGTFGACALLASFVGRASLLAVLGSAAPPALVLVGCASRLAPVWQMRTLAYVSRDHAKSRRVAGVRSAQAVVATGWFVVAAVVGGLAGTFAWTRLLALVAVLSLVTVATGWRYSRRLGGVTGDFLGATEQLCELAGYAVFAWGIRS